MKKQMTAKKAIHFIKKLDREPNIVRRSSLIRQISHTWQFMFYEFGKIYHATKQPSGSNEYSLLVDLDTLE